MDSVTLAPELIEQIVEILVREANPEKIILFGSHARGDARRGSDIDILVVEQTVPGRRAEIVRLSEALSPLKLSIELLVADESHYNSSWADFPGSYLYHAVREGKVLYDVDRRSPAVVA